MEQERHRSLYIPLTLYYADPKKGTPAFIEPLNPLNRDRILVYFNFGFPVRFAILGWKISPSPYKRLGITLTFPNPKP